MSGLNNKATSVYVLKKSGKSYIINQTSSQKIFAGDQFYRRCYSTRLPDIKNIKGEDFFKDSTFQIRKELLQDNKQLELKRLYDICGRSQKQLFDDENFTSSFLEYEKRYPPFISELEMLDHDYIKTIFFTTKINSQGYYQYFVRRDGEYYIQYIDDQIPVYTDTEQPIWGLNFRQPWKIILSKAWLKQNHLRNQNIMDNRPFEFIQAFGMPGYRALHLKKQMDYLANSQLKNQTKLTKQKKIPINQKGFIVIGKTRSSDHVAKMGLFPDRAGYKITPLAEANSSIFVSQSQHQDVRKTNLKQDALYLVTSSLHHHWVGDYSIVRPAGNLKQFNLERDFVASYNQISHIFSKFYLTPQFNSPMTEGNLLQQSIKQSFKMKNYCFYELNVTTKGFLNLNIQLPSLYEQKKYKGQQYLGSRYPQIKYLMAREEGYDQNNNRFKQFSFYDGECVKSYHKSCNRFLSLDKGIYYIYVKIESKKQKQLNFVININTNATIKSFVKRDLLPKNQQTILKCVLYKLSLSYGMKTYIHKQKKDLIIYLANFFDQYGFGIVSLRVHDKSKSQLALTLNQSKLSGNALYICKQAHTEEFKENKLTLIAKANYEQVLIFERQIGGIHQKEKFPPPNIIDFYEISIQSLIK